jgi:hypothetical protein
LTGARVPHDTRDQVVDFIKNWSAKPEIAAKRLVGWFGIRTSKFHHWKGRYGKVNEAQRQDSTRLLAGRLGEENHRRLPGPFPAGRLSPADVAG